MPKLEQLASQDNVLVKGKIKVNVIGVGKEIFITSPQWKGAKGLLDEIEKEAPKDANAFRAKDGGKTNNPPHDPYAPRYYFVLVQYYKVSEVNF